VLKRKTEEQLEKKICYIQVKKDKVENRFLIGNSTNEKIME
jgi:hypothetical protein